MMSDNVLGYRVKDNGTMSYYTDSLDSGDLYGIKKDIKDRLRYRYIVGHYTTSAYDIIVYDSEDRFNLFNELIDKYYDIDDKEVLWFELADNGFLMV